MEGARLAPLDGLCDGLLAEKRVPVLYADLTILGKEGAMKRSRPEDGPAPEDREAGKETGARKPYSTPMLVEYGSVVELTQGPGGTLLDGRSGLARIPR